MLVFVAVYVLLVPGLFYLTIRGVHRKMVEFRTVSPKKLLLNFSMSSFKQPKT